MSTARALSGRVAGIGTSRAWSTARQGGPGVGNVPARGSRRVLDVLGVGLLVVVSGNPTVFYFPKEAVYPVTLGFMFLAWTRNRTRPLLADWIIIGVFAGLGVAHLVVFGDDVLTSSVGFMVRLLAAMLAVRAIPDFEDRLIDVLTAAAVLSFVFYLPMAAGIDLASATSDLRIQIEWLTSRHIGLHNFMIPSDELRNAGMFGEPGMFAGFIVLALLLGVIGRVRRSKVTWGILFCALLSTFSTAGYATGAAVVLIASYSTGSRSRLVWFIRSAALTATLVTVAAFAWEQVEFIGEKIEHQLDEAAQRTDYSRLNRFGNLMYDLDHLQQRPIIGWSTQPRTRLVLDRDVEELASGQGNGLSNFAVKFGLVGFSTFFLAAYRRFRRSVAWPIAAGACVILAMLLVGEPHLNGPLFMTLMFALPRRRGLETTTVAAPAVARLG